MFFKSSKPSSATKHSSRPAWDIYDPVIQLINSLQSVLYLLNSTDIVFPVSETNKQKTTNFPPYLSINKCSWAQMSQSARKTNGPRVLIWGCLPSLVLPGKSPTHARARLCLHEARRQMPGDTCLPLDVWPRGNTHKICHSNERAISHSRLVLCPLLESLGISRRV